MDIGPSPPVSGHRSIPSSQWTASCAPASRAVVVVVEVGVLVLALTLEKVLLVNTHHFFFTNIN